MNNWVWIGLGLMIFGVILTIISVLHIINNKKNGMNKEMHPKAPIRPLESDIQHTKHETIHTDRLEIVPLRYEYLYMLVYDISALEHVLDFKYDATPISGDFKAVLESQLKVLEREKENYLWCSFWLIIKKSNRTVVGSIDFKDLPNKNGEVEIGYGLGKAYENKGYMTEAVRAFCKFAFDHPTVEHVIAETEMDNKASQNVLKNCGFKEASRSDTIWWRN